MTSLKVQIDEKLAREFSAVCDREGRERDSLVGELITRYVERQESDVDEKLNHTDFSALTGLVSDGNAES